MKEPSTYQIAGDVANRIGKTSFCERCGGRCTFPCTKHAPDAVPERSRRATAVEADRPPVCRSIAACLFHWRGAGPGDRKRVGPRMGCASAPVATPQRRLENL